MFVGEQTSLQWVTAGGQFSQSLFSGYFWVSALPLSSVFLLKVSNASYWVRVGISWDLLSLQLFQSHSLLALCDFILQKIRRMVNSLERDKRCNHL